MKTGVKVLFVTLLVITLLAVSSALYFWYKKPDTITTKEYVKVPEIQKVVTVKRVEVPGPERVVTIEKRVIIDKLKLPEWFKSDANEQAIATAEISPYKGKTNAVAILNTKTGVGQIIAKQEPLPLIAFENDREIGIRGGIHSSGSPEAAVYGKWDFLRVGSMHLGVYGDASVRDSKADARIQIGVGYRF
jgi:hypothetical protein